MLKGENLIAGLWVGADSTFTNEPVRGEPDRFATGTERQADLTRYIPYGPSRHSAAMRITTHADSGIDMRLHIPTHPLNAERAVTKDEAWYARTRERIGDYFRAALFPDAGETTPDD